MTQREAFEVCERIEERVGLMVRLYPLDNETVDRIAMLRWAWEFASKQRDLPTG